MRAPVRLSLRVFAALTVCFFFGSWLEAANAGPYTTWFNHRLRDRAAQANLVGRPQADVERVLGAASRERDVREAVPGAALPVTRHTYDYYPYPWAPESKFEVRCEQGVVAAFHEFEP